MISSIAELVKKLKEINKSKSLCCILTKNTSNKNNENKVEQEVHKFLIENGVVETSGSLKPNSFIFQPNGTQKSPDFSVMDISGLSMDIEVKSGKTMMFNSGIPNPNYFYMLEYIDGTAYRGYGNEIFDPLVFEVMPTLRKEFDEHNDDALTRITNKGLFTPAQIAFIKSSGLILYPRAMTPGIQSNNIMWMKNTPGV